MSPHAFTPDTSGPSSPTSPRRMNGNNSHVDLMPKSLLRRFDDDEVHDLICIGFGPASLAIAVALHDGLETGSPNVFQREPKVRFLERQAGFAWHAGMLLPGTKMQITFLKDMATFRNPRSEFTFLNYLHQKGRLVSFTNLSTFLPQRIEYEDYMRWCAGHFEDVVDYGQNVEAVDVGRRDPKTGAVEFFEVKSWDRKSNAYTVRRAKNVVVAVGGQPQIPKGLRADHPRVIHSSQYATSISDIFPPGTKPRSVAVIGAGQSAAEVFHNIPSRFPGSKAYLLIKGSALRPSDDSPFVNEVFDPERVDDVYSQDPTVRANGLALDKGTNYGVVRLELLEEIYSQLYSYRIHYESEKDWPQQILTYRTVTGMSDSPTKGGSALQLQIENNSGTYHANLQSKVETLDVDLVVVASGYKRDAHEHMLQNLEPLRSSGGGPWDVGRDYSVKFTAGAVNPDAGVWLQGCNEKTHGLSDTLLSILAVRGGEMVESIFGPSSSSSSQARQAPLRSPAMLETMQ